MRTLAWGIVLLSLILFVPLMCMSAEKRTTAEDSEAQSSVPDTVRSVIDAWMIRWSEKQAASIQEVCEQESGCDPTQYLPSAEPETSFGWDGADRIEKTHDWAEGPRYHAEANGRTVLVYMKNRNVHSVYSLTSDERRNLCRGVDDCW